MADQVALGVAIAGAGFILARKYKTVHQAPGAGDLSQFCFYKCILLAALHVVFTMQRIPSLPKICESFLKPNDGYGCGEVEFIASTRGNHEQKKKGISIV